jgi:hypothetical protein
MPAWVVALLLVLAVGGTGLITLLLVDGEDEGDGEATPTSAVTTAASGEITASAETSASGSDPIDGATEPTDAPGPTEAPDAGDGGEEGEASDGPAPEPSPEPEPEPEPPAEERGPANLTAEFGEGTVTLRWDDAVGESSYAWEIGVFSEDAGSGSAGDLGADVTEHFDNARCDREVHFTLIARRADGTEIGRVSDTFDTPECRTITNRYGPIEIVASSTVTVPPGETQSARAQCPPDTAVIGGGFSSGGNIGAEPLGHVLASHGSGTHNWWQASLQAPPDREGVIQAYAVCLPGADTTHIGNGGWAEEGSLATEPVECEEGTLVSGGFFSKHPNVDLFGSFRDGASWKVTAYGARGSGGFASSAICLLDEDVAMTEAEATDGVPEGTGLPAVFAGPCPGESVLAGGGFSLGFNGIPEVMLPFEDVWRVQVWAPEGSGTGAVVVSRAMCLGLR